MNIKNRRNFILKLIIVFILIAVSSLSNAQTVYVYDSAAGLWKKINRNNNSVSLVTQEPLSSVSTTSTVIPLLGTFVIEPSIFPENETALSVASRNRWYYYITYTVTNAQQESHYNILAGQNIEVGMATVWNDATKIYVKFDLTNGWLASESHLHFLQNEPNESFNPAPGQFPFSAKHIPSTATYTYEITFADIQNKCGFPPQQGGSIYILLHLSVKKGTQSETAWAGPELTNCFSVYISATHLNWFLRKPGDYATKAFDVTVTSSSYPVLVTFRNFDNPVNEVGTTLQTYFAFDALGDWITPSQLNDLSKTLQPGTSTFSLYHRVILQGQSACTYSNAATITFALLMIRSQVIK